MSFESQEAKIRGFERGHRAVHLIDIGLRFGIFEALQGHPEGLTAAELALTLMLHEPYLETWLRTAYHFDILDFSHEDRFTLQPHLAEIMGTAPLPDLDFLYHDLDRGDLPQARMESPLHRYIRTGAPVDRGRSPEESLATSRATKGVYQVFLSVVLERYGILKQMLKQGARFLDIGCGSGYLLMELAHAFDQSFFVGVDPDIYGIERAQSAATGLGLDDRITFEEMGAEELPYKNSFDMIAMVATLHEILPEVRLRAVRNAHRALKTEGQLLILDYPYPERMEDFRNKRYSIGIIEQYFEVASGIVHLGAGEQNILLNQAGFHHIRRDEINKGMFDLIVATR